MRLFNVGDRVIIDDESGTIEQVIMDYLTGNKYDVRYGHTFMLAVDVPEDEIEPWMPDEQ
jgi:hypothetical protein